MFLCVSLSDLLPELQFHRHDRVLLTIALILGLGVAWLAGQFHHHEHGDLGHDEPHVHTMTPEPSEGPGHAEHLGHTH